jgi:hypothetical protein
MSLLVVTLIVTIMMILLSSSNVNGVQLRVQPYPWSPETMLKRWYHEFSTIAPDVTLNWTTSPGLDIYIASNLTVLLSNDDAPDLLEIDALLLSHAVSTGTSPIHPYIING